MQSTVAGASMEPKLGEEGGGKGEEQGPIICLSACFEEVGGSVVGVGESGFGFGGGEGRGKKQDLRTMSKSHTH